MAWLVDTGTRQGPHGDDRPGCRHAADVGGRPSPRSRAAWRGVDVRSVRGDGGAVRGHPDGTGRSGGHGRSGAAATRPSRRCAAVGAARRDACARS